LSLLPKIPQILQSQSSNRLIEMSEIGKSIYSSHFSSLNNIVISTIYAIEGRIIPGRTRSRMEWNNVKKDLKLFLIIIIDKNIMKEKIKTIFNFLNLVVYNFALICENQTVNCNLIEKGIYFYFI
jgi:hypothetical protein